MNLDLNEKEVRVLGALVEKELSTPEYYPMTLNALATACNQKTNRDPVVSYSESDVMGAVEGLQRKRLAGSSTSTYGRAVKYRHALAEVMELKRPQLALLASLLLRGPETSGELRGRTERMHGFTSLEDVDSVLESLMDHDPSLVTRLPRKPGQKEARYAHLLSGKPDVRAENDDVNDTMADELESRIARLEDQLEELRNAFAEFRRQFE